MSFGTLTPEQIMAAKKTITITVEIDDQKYIEELDGSKGLAVLVDHETQTGTRLIVDGEGLSNFAYTLLKKIYQECPAMVISILTALEKNDDDRPKLRIMR